MVEYKLLCKYELNGNNKYLHTDNELSCRFCGKRTPDVTFNNIAHSVSEFLGNKKIVNKFECDCCNKKFSKYESDFSVFLLLYRSLRNFRGKSHVLKTVANKVTSDYNYEQKTLSIKAEKNWGKDLKMELHTNGVKFQKTVKYKPINIFRSMIKYALSILPYDEFCNYTHYFRFFDDNNITPVVPSEFFDIHTIIIDKPIENPKICVYQNRLKVLMAPKIYIALEFGNFVFNIFLYANTRTETLKPFASSLNSILKCQEYAKYGVFNQVFTKNYSSSQITTSEQEEFCYGKFSKS